MRSCVCVCMLVYMSGKCTPHKLQFTQILLSFMGCLPAFLHSCLLACYPDSLTLLGVYLHGNVVASMAFLHCSTNLLIFHVQSWAELKLGEMRMNDLFKWPRPASLIHSIPDTQNTCDHALSLKCTKSNTIYSKIEQVVHSALLFIQTW